MEEPKPSTTASTRTKRTAATAKFTEPDTVEPEPKKRGRTRAVKADEALESKVASKTTTTATKSRGRAKKDATCTEPVAVAKPEPVTTRQTRARAASTDTNTSALPEPTISVVVPAKKKVTFEALPEEDDEKENKRPKTVAKGKSAKTATSTTKKNEPAATGMRAKPIRKPVSTRTTKTTRGTSTKVVAVPADEMDVDISEKKAARALTPKKITQVAKAIHEENADDEEDELSGAKTPVRDLSMSPKRGLTPANRTMSPVKKLDFAPSLNPTSPNHNDAMGIMSPPRRLPQSPVKDSLKESPRRAPEGVTIFRAQVPDANNPVSFGLSPAKNNALLQQSPKRGLTDSVVFPPSTSKSRATPLKTSFLSSPARRLFSVSKQKTPSRLSFSPKKFLEKENVQHKEVEASSHFRSSVSPQRSARVYRLSEDELAQEADNEINFDQSVLDVRSPPKVDKVKPVVVDSSAYITTPTALDNFEHSAEQDQHSEPRSPVTSTSEDKASDHGIDTEDASGEEASHGVAPNEVSADEVMSDEPEPEQPANKSRMSGALFRHLREVDDESEDELAGDETPDNRILRPSFRPSMSAANIRSRLSNGIAPESASRNLGFTPLATQVQGWRARSPEKRTPAATSKSQGLFSPLARMHVEGSVELNRPNTPGSKRKSLAGRLSVARSLTESPAKSDFFADGMAAQDFEERGETNDVDLEQQEDLHALIDQENAETTAAGTDPAQVEIGETPDELPGAPELTTDLVNFTKASDTAMVDFKALANEAEALAEEEDDGESVIHHELEADSIDEEGSVISASTTSQEQEDTEAEHDDEVPTISVAEHIEEEQSILSTSSGSYADENAAPVEEATEATELLPAAAETADSEGDSYTGANVQPNQFEATAASIEVTPPKQHAVSAHVDEVIEGMDFSVTPIRPDPGLPRHIHTVVSKVPLRSEGETTSALSPLKVQRKRSRSLSASDSQSVKRRSLESSFTALPPQFNLLTTPKANGNSFMSPQRRIRSAAPSPANSAATGLTTPGQISFAIDDFGDSTLDGIDLPEGELMSDEVEHTEIADQDESVMTIGSALFKTPVVPKRRSVAPSSRQSVSSETSHFAMSTKSTKSRVGVTPRATPSKSAAPASRTPATAAKAKTPATKSKAPQNGRTPLKAVGSGVLNGAVIHTDIHTSDGMDASAFYIDTLMTMGARVVKEWRWNPRASAAASEQDQAEVPLSPGITHVVYKDGGKRTLEKVRSARGQVLCVGVGWVLDCMREGKWLDEDAYAVDQTIMPRGGSRRRKSMEPRMLINENGFLSATKDRRSWSMSLGVELAGMSDDMKMDLINTPVRGKEIFEKPHNDDIDNAQEAAPTVIGVEDETDISSTYNSVNTPVRAKEVLAQAHARGVAAAIGGIDDESEISSTFNSPTAATVGGGGDTANVGLLMNQHQVAQTPGSTYHRRHANMQNPSTPQSVSNLAVDYDPRTAATPLTPYLVAEGRDLIQMSAPPKQVNKGIFEKDDEDDSLLIAAEKEKVTDGGKKFQIKNGKKVPDGRRKTLGVPGLGFGYKPVVGSPLRKE